MTSTLPLSLICATIYCFCFTLWALGLTSRRLVCAQTRPSAHSTFNRVAFNTGLISIELTFNHFSATFLACLCTLNTDFPASLTLSYSSIWNQNVPQEIPFFIQNQYSAIARKRSNTTAIIVRVKI